MDSLTAQMGNLVVEKDHVEDLKWLQNISSSDTTNKHFGLDKKHLCEWLQIGAPDPRLMRPYEYCKASTVDALIAAKQQEVGFSSKEKAFASERINRYEAIGKHFFTTRTSMKCANIDALIRFSSLPATAAPNDTLTYADITASCDSGVIEYMQWRKGIHCCGYAFDVGQPLWRNVPLDKRPTSVLHCDGSLNGPDAMRRFISFVHQHEPDGVYLTYSDNMIQPDDDDQTIAIRENWCKQQVLSNCALSLAVLRSHGTAIVKIMETFTPFSMGLIYLLRLCFGRMAIVKIRASRLNSGERYLILRDRIADTNFVQMIVEHLLCTNESLIRMLASGETDIIELVPAQRFTADADAIAFTEYMRQSIELLADAQTQALQKRFVELQRPNRHRNDVSMKMEIRNACYKEWNVPDFDDLMKPSVFVRSLSRHLKTFYGVNANMTMFNDCVKDFSTNPVSKLLHNWHFTTIANTAAPTFFCHMGENRMFRWSAEQVWSPVEEMDSVSLPAGTLVLGELCQEFSSESGSDVVVGKASKVLHVIDVLCLHFENLQRVSMSERRHRLRTIANQQSDEDGYFYVRPLFPICEMLEFVRKAKHEWKLISGNKDKELMFMAVKRWYRAGGIGFLFADRGAFLERPLLWDWRINTFDLLNKAEQGDPSYFCWFENRLAKLQSNRRPNIGDFRPNRGRFNNRPNRMSNVRY